MAKLKAKKIKEGPKSEEEVREALEELEANLDPTKVSKVKILESRIVYHNWYNSGCLTVHVAA